MESAHLAIPHRSQRRLLPPPKRKRIDRGKVRALHDAGWSNVKIADEMGCAESSISMILKEYNE